MEQAMSDAVEILAIAIVRLNRRGKICVAISEPQVPKRNERKKRYSKSSNKRGDKSP